MYRWLGALSIVFMCASVFAEVPSACRECMSECPHVTRDIKDCDRGCPKVCSKAQADIMRKKQTEATATKGCFECMSECPHVTRDIKACDNGCPNECDPKSMKDAFIRANGLAQKCGSTTGKADGSATR